MAIGDFELKGQSGATYTLNFGVNAMCRIEEKDLQQRTYNLIVAEMQTGHPSMRTVRTVMAGALVSPANQTVEQAGEIVEDIGGIAIVIAAFTQTRTSADRRRDVAPTKTRSGRKARG
ncbi:MAG TPA: hypothetical protein VF491_17480 [Vicinamibacterales bacterium]